MGKVALWVACRRCTRPFDTGLRMEEGAFRRGTLAANYHTCPACGARETYRKADYQTREAPPGRRPPRGAQADGEEVND